MFTTINRGYVASVTYSNILKLFQKSELAKIFPSTCIVAKFDEDLISMHFKSFLTFACIDKLLNLNSFVCAKFLYISTKSRPSRISSFP